MNTASLEPHNTEIHDFSPRKGTLSRTTLALGVGAMASAVPVAGMAVNAGAATSTTHDAHVIHDAAVTASQYESCTPYFGLGKGTAELAKFTIEDPNHVLSTPAVLGTDLIPLITVSDGTHTVTCAPTLAWTNQQDWATNTNVFFGMDNWPATDGAFSYPGDGYYAVPMVGDSYTLTQTLSGSPTGTMTPTSVTVSYGSNLPSDVRVATVPSAIATTVDPSTSFGSISPSSTVGQALITKVSNAIPNSDTNKAAEIALFSDLMQNGSNACASTYGGGDQTSAVFTGLTSAIQSLFTSTNTTVNPNCSFLGFTGFVMLQAVGMDLRAHNNLIHFALTSTASTTTTTTSPTTTTTTPTLPSTGSDQGLLAGIAVALVAIGGLVLGIRRRSRRVS
jgi:LPXTG-motif cell wall-anchored protein